MDTLQQLKDELRYEYVITQHFMEIYPARKNDYRVHEKSYQLIALVNHILNVFGWPAGILQTDEMDVAPKDGERPVLANNSEDLLKKLKTNFDASMAALENATEDDLKKQWSLKAGDKTLMQWDKYAAIRHSLNQITHHRAQLGVNYRLLNLELPHSYGPTADHSSFA